MGGMSFLTLPFHMSPLSSRDPPLIISAPDYVRVFAHPKSVLPRFGMAVCGLGSCSKSDDGEYLTPAVLFSLPGSARAVPRGCRVVGYADEAAWPRWYACRRLQVLIRAAPSMRLLPYEVAKLLEQVPCLLIQPPLLFPSPLLQPQPPTPNPHPSSTAVPLHTLSK